MDRAMMVWVATNLLRGTPRAAIHDTLLARGLAPEEADEALTQCEASPVFEAAAPFVEDARRREMLSRRSDALLRSVPAARGVSHLPFAQTDTFFAQHVAEGVPAVLTGAARAMHAFERWTWDTLRQEYGAAMVRPTRKRPFDPDSRTVTSPLAELRFDELLTHACTHPATPSDPGYYLVAAEPALRGALSGLRADIVRDPRVFMEDSDGSATHMWLGPRGTRTEFHHDEDHIVAFQVRGTKRFRLVPPLDPVFMRGAVATFNELHWDHPDVASAFVREVDLEAGDALFIPAGYWHAALALEPSITLSLTRLRCGTPPRLRLDGRA